MPEMQVRGYIYPQILCWRCRGSNWYLTQENKWICHNCDPEVKPDD